ncbi:MAG: diguanylate cyclase domain-containing protein [Solirubrobacterales bacterium]
MRLSFRLGLIAVLLLGAGSVAAALLVRDNEEDHFHRTQHDEALRSAHQAQAVALLSVGELDTAAAFFQADGRFSRHQFEIVGRSLLRRGALTATAYLQRVTAGERRGFERSHGFSVFERGAGGRPKPANKRPEYFPVTYVVAEQNGQTPLGYDVGSDPDRGPYLRRARDSGRPAATGVMPLLIGGMGINVYRPVYRDGAPTATVAERRAALLGFAAGAFRVRDLANAAIATIPNDVAVQIHDGGTTLLGPDKRLEDPASAPITIADRTWLLVVRDPNRPSIALPLLIGVLGLSLATVLGALVLVWSRGERMRELQRQAHQDALTGLKNRRRFEEDLHIELARSRREGATAALLMLDLDNFKRVNDTLGHPIGDRVIEEVAGILDHRTRETDVLARVGGDEFAIVLPHCDAAEARSVADTITTAIREHVPQPVGVPQITASIGIALFGAGTEATFDSVLAEADAAMYAAKQAGRDGVRLA